MPRLNKPDEVALTKWTALRNDADRRYAAATTEEARDTIRKDVERYNEHIENIGARATARRNTIDRHKGKKKSDYDPANDPKPECTCGGLQFCSQDCALTRWERRQDEYYAAHPKKTPTPPAVIEAPKEPTKPTPDPIVEEFLNDLQLDAWAEPAPVVRKPVVKPAPKKITLASKPAPVIAREPREGWSGRYFKENFWDLPVYERNAKLKIYGGAAGYDPEWGAIIETMQRPVVVPKPLTDAERTANEAIKTRPTLPIMTDAAYAHQEFARNAATETVEEARKRTASTMVNATPDSGVSVPIDQRGWRNADQIHTPTMVPTTKDGI